MFDQTESGRRLKWLPVLGEFTRECLAQKVERSKTSTGEIKTFDWPVVQRGAPEFAANAVKDCIMQKGFKTLFIEPVSHWHHCYSESFNVRFRDEFFNVESFTSLLEAKVLGEEHRDKCNLRRPHSSLGDPTPAEFAGAFKNQPGCSQAPSASDEFRSHSRLPEPVSNPRSSAPEKSRLISNPDPTKTPSFKTKNPKTHRRAQSLDFSRWSQFPIRPISNPASLIIPL